MTLERDTILRWSLVGVAALTLVGAGALVAWRVRSLSAQTEALARLEAENRTLRTKATQSADEIADLRRQLGMPAAATAGQGQSAQQRQLAETVSARLEAVRLIGQLRDSLAAANGTISSLQGRIQELEAAAQKSAADNKRLTASEDDLKERLGGTNRIIEAMQAELKGRNDRATQLDIANHTLRQENKTLGDKCRQTVQAHRDLEEINRRREIFLGTLMRRCRDVTDQLRVLSTHGESSRDAISGGGDLSRLQSAVTMAEDDLRQLSALNAQAQRLVHKLTGH